MPTEPISSIATGRIRSGISAPRLRSSAAADAESWNSTHGEVPPA